MKTAGTSLNNPFEYSGPIADRERAVPRTSDRRRLLQGLSRADGPKYYSVMGARQTGKTTFLFELHREMPTAIYADFEKAECQEVGGMVAELHRTVLERHRDSFFGSVDSHQMSPLRFFKEVARLGHEIDSRIIFFIDELAASANHARDFLRDLRAHSHEELIGEFRATMPCFVITGSVDLAILTMNQNGGVSPYNIAEPVFIKDFTQAEASSFIERMAAEVFMPEVVEQIYRQTSGHPFLLQFLCHRLFSRSAKEHADFVADPEKVCDEMGVGESVNITSMMNDLWHSSSRAETTTRALRFIAQTDQTALPSLANSSISRLSLNGCIKRDPAGRWSIRNPIYERAFKRQLEFEAAIADPPAQPAAPAARAFAPGEGARPFEFDRSLIESMGREFGAEFQRQLAGPPVQNYRGFVCALLVGDNQTPVPRPTGEAWEVVPGQSCRLLVWFAPDAPPSAAVRSIDIVRGVQLPEARFDVAVDSVTIEVSPSHHVLAAREGHLSEQVQFVFEAPRKRGEHLLWVNVEQRLQAVECVELRLHVQQRTKRTRQHG